MVPTHGIRTDAPGKGPDPIRRVESHHFSVLQSPQLTGQIAPFVG